MENVDNTIIEKPKLSKKSNKKIAELEMQESKTKTCRVIKYDEKLRELYVVFDGYGISIKNVESFDGSKTVSIKYTGEIGNADFSCKV